MNNHKWPERKKNVMNVDRVEHFDEQLQMSGKKCNR